MNWINMLNWWQWLIMAALPPLIIMLYFLKLRRMPVEVPSTYLWKKTIEDLHVNSIWQRLRQNLLLWLQLLILLAIILSLLRPGSQSSSSIENRSIIMVDNSASMQATDVGKSRLQSAKDQALELVSTMTRDDVAMVIAFSDRADVRQGYTSDKKRLRSAIDSIAPTSRTTDLTEALKTASGLANPGRTSQIEDINDIQVAEAVPATLYILSDGGFTPPPGDLGNLSAKYIPIGADSGNNVAILAFTCERNQEKVGRIEAFASLKNFGDSATSFEAALILDDQLIDAASVNMAAGETRGLSFEIDNVSQGKLELRIQPQDDLSVDNVAYAALTPSRELEVMLVTKGNTPLVSALKTPQAEAMANVRVIQPQELESDAMKQLAASGSVDLFIYDGCTPPSMPEANTLFIGSSPPGGQWIASESSGPLFVIDIHRSHPLLQYVDLAALLIAEGLSLEIPAGGTELVRTDAGILMAVAPRDAYQDAVVGMNLLQNNTNWPNRRSFPIFLLNSLEFLGGTTATSAARTFRPGNQATMNVASRFNRVNVETPSGKNVTLSRDGQPQIVFSQTDDLGTYIVKDSDQNRTLQMFTVNLFSEQESNLAPAQQVTIGLQAVEASGNQARLVRAEYWRWLLLLALLVLGLEWYLYTKRVAI